MECCVVNTGSSGNTYVFKSTTGECLVVDAGEKLSDTLKYCNWSTSSISGLLLSHIHITDHAKYLHEFWMAGIDCYMSYGSAYGMGLLNNHRIKVVKHGQKFKVGSFDVMALDVKHDAPEPLMYLIRHNEMGLCMFMTDSYYMPYNIPGLNNIIIEANYCEDIIQQKMSENGFLRDRIIENHYSLQSCKKFLHSQDLSWVNNIVLIHLSPSNSDPKRFKKEVEELTGKTVHIAYKGLIIENFNISPF